MVAYKLPVAGFALAALTWAGSAFARPPAPPPPPPPPPPMITQWSVRETIIMRIPVRPEPGPVRWAEKGSRKCLDVENIVRASLVSSQILDFTLRNGERWRMRFRDACPSIGFYRGFYLRPNEDGQLCAGRDTIRLRSGGECEIDSFRRLKLTNGRGEGE